MKFNIQFDGFFEMQNIRKQIQTWIKDNDLEIKEQKEKVKPDSYQLKLKLSRSYTDYAKIEGEINLSIQNIKDAKIRKNNEEKDIQTGYIEMLVDLDKKIDEEKPFKEKSDKINGILKNTFKDLIDDEKDYLDEEVNRMIQEIREKISTALQLYN
ncbi:MAG: hypothetical protein QXD62_00925 [Candidatus Woesearchaeota archaeon]